MDTKVVPVTGNVIPFPRKNARIEPGPERRTSQDSSPRDADRVDFRAWYHAAAIQQATFPRKT